MIQQNYDPLNWWPWGGEEMTRDRGLEEQLSQGDLNKARSEGKKIVSKWELLCYVGKRLKCSLISLLSSRYYAGLQIECSNL